MAKSVRQIKGVLSADINFATSVFLLEYDIEADPRARAIGVVVGAGHGIEPLDEEERENPVAASSNLWVSRYRAEIGVALSGTFIALAWALGTLGYETPSTFAYIFAIIAGGTITWRRAATSIMARTVDMNVLMTLAVTGAATIGEWGEGATVIFLFALGGLLESRSLTRTRQSIRELIDLAPARARVLRDGAEAEVLPAEVEVGELVVVRPGERVPLDGEIVTGHSAFDESPITGESVPADRGPGQQVFAGSLNTSGLVTLRSTATASDTTLARIVHLVEAAQASRAPVQRFVDRFSRIYTPIVLVGAVLIAVGAPAFGEMTGIWPGFESAREWIYRALVLLVVSCPCALVVSTPVAIVSAITRATRDGVLVKGGAYLELAGKVKAIVFDKTGTLTEGRPVVAQVVPLGDGSRDAILRRAAAVEAHSNHPLASAVVAAGPTVREPVADVRETPGRGVTGMLADERVSVGSVAYAIEHGIDAESIAAPVEQLEAEGLTVLVVLSGEPGDATALGLVGIADALRPEAARMAASLAASGVEHLVMLTGDNPRAAARVAHEAGIAEYRAGLLPQDKTAAIERLREQYGVVAMVGDGVNDAPALATADIGIAMGAAGSHTAIETADVALMRDDLSALPGLFDLGRRTMANIRQNVVLSLGVKAVVLVLAAGGMATLWMAVFADTGVALIVIANGLRLLRSR